MQICINFLNSFLVKSKTASARARIGVGAILRARITSKAGSILGAGAISRVGLE